VPIGDKNIQPLLAVNYSIHMWFVTIKSLRRINKVLKHNWQRNMNYTHKASPQLMKADNLMKEDHISLVSSKCREVSKSSCEFDLCSYGPLLRLTHTPCLLVLVSKYIYHTCTHLMIASGRSSGTNAVTTSLIDHMESENMVVAPEHFCSPFILDLSSGLSK